MSTNRELLDGDGSVCVDVNDEAERRDLAREFKVNETNISKKYYAEYHVPERGKADLDAAVALACKKAGRTMISINELRNAISTLMEANVIPRRDDESSWEKLTTPPPPPEPEVERDVHGHPLSEAQKIWKGYREWTEAHSCDEARQRAKSDAGYANYHRKTVEQQFEAVKSSGGAVRLNDGGTSSKKAGPSLEAWARLYLAESCEHLKPKGGFVEIAGEKCKWEDFLMLQSAAKAKGLIG